jgi:hypothetical protein
MESLEKEKQRSGKIDLQHRMIPVDSPSRPSRRPPVHSSISVSVTSVPLGDRRLREKNRPKARTRARRRSDQVRKDLA